MARLATCRRGYVCTGGLVRTNGCPKFRARWPCCSPLFWDRFERKLSKSGGGTIALLTEFMPQWYSETVRWTNALAKVTAAESTENKELLSAWLKKWVSRLCEAIEPVAIKAFGPEGTSELAEVKEELLARLG